MSGLTGQALYDKMCTLESEIFDLMGDPARTRRVGEFDREQFARKRAEEMRSDPSWQTTFSPTNQELMVKAVLSAGRESC